jgi:hypothetical protein
VIGVVRRKYVLEILWDTGDLTETRIDEEGLKLLEKYGTTYLILRFYLEGDPNARPVSYQVWDPEAKEDVTPSQEVAHA